MSSSSNIKLDNVDNLEVIRPLKRRKYLELMDSESELDKDENEPSPPSPSIQTTFGIIMESADQNSKEENFSADEHTIVKKFPGEIEQRLINCQTYDEIPIMESADQNSKEENFSADQHMIVNKLPGEIEQQLINDQTYDKIPQDYTMTDNDLCAHITIETSKATDILVKIDDIFVNQDQLMCLLDPEKYLNDNVISAYICCLKDQGHLQVRNGVKVYFENPINSGLLKHDGHITVNEDGNFITKIVKNYLSYDMILLPINIKNTHWYLAVVHAKKCEIQVLDSLCWEFNRDDLSTTLKGLQYHLNIIIKKGFLVERWNDLDVTEWTIKEQFKDAIQKDGSSCGLFMLKFMEYWSGDDLTQHITQENIDHFRNKLAGILLCWKTNSAGMIRNLDQSQPAEDSSNDIIFLENKYIQKESKSTDLLTSETKYQSLLSVLSNISDQELISCLCDYIKSINCADTLKKIWVQSCKPYPISLNLNKLQHMLKDNEPMDPDCFNLIVRNNMSEYIEEMKKIKGPITKHYLDLQFWVTIDFGRHPNFRKVLDMQQLAESIHKWPGIDYNVSRCKSILIPISELIGGFILFILNLETKSVYILDPNPFNPIFKYNPNAKYVKKLICISDFLQKAMTKAHPGSRWNEDIFLWRQIIVTDIPIVNSELSGFAVSMFMSAWKDELHLPQIKGGYELRKHFLGKLLTMKENNCVDNLPAGVQEFIRLIKKNQI